MSLYQYWVPNPDPLTARSQPWLKGRKTTNLFQATKTAMVKGWRLQDLSTLEFVIKRYYEPPELTTHEDRSVGQLRRDPKWVASQVFVNA